MADGVVFLITAAYVDGETKVVGHQRYWTSDPLAAEEARKDPTLQVQLFTDAERAALAKSNPRALLKSGDPVAVDDASEEKLAQVVARDGKKPTPRRLPAEELAEVKGARGNKR